MRHHSAQTKRTRPRYSRRHCSRLVLGHHGMRPCGGYGKRSDTKWRSAATSLAAWQSEARRRGKNASEKSFLVSSHQPGSPYSLSVRDSYWWVMVCSVRVESVCVSSFGEGLAVWVLPPREDRGRRADRIGLVLLNWYKSVHVVQPPRSRPRHPDLHE